MSDKPNEYTSNYGWALWHLQEAEGAIHPEAAQAHAMCAQARATLALINSNESMQQMNPPEMSVWGKEPKF